jgi:hypothetical protein
MTKGLVQIESHFLLKQMREQGSGIYEVLAVGFRDSEKIGFLRAARRTIGRAGMRRKLETEPGSGEVRLTIFYHFTVDIYTNVCA